MNKPFLDQAAWTIALLFSGVAAGMFLMDFLGYYPVLPRLASQTAIEVHQHSLPLRRSLFRAAIGGSGIASLVLWIFFSNDSSRRLLVANLICLAALIAYTNWALIPLNREIASWIAASPPSDWKFCFSKMIARERLRSFVAAFAFALQLIAFVARTRLPADEMGPDGVSPSGGKY